MAGIADFLKVEMALTTAPFALTPTWTDITSQVRAGSRIERQLGHNGPGTASIVVDNRDGRWDPSSGYVSSPYAGNIVRDRLLRVTCSNNTFSSATGLFAGFLTDVRLHATEFDAFAVLEVSDALRLLEEYKLDDWTRTAELTGTRAGALLTQAGIPNGGSQADFRGTVDAGTVQMPARTYTGSALSALQDIARAEMALMYVDVDGLIQFYDRHELIHATARNTAQIQVDDDDYLPPLDLDIAGFSKTVAVSTTGDSGNAFTYTAGATTNFPETMRQELDLQVRFDADVESLAQSWQKMGETADTDSRPSGVRMWIAAAQGDNNATELSGFVDSDFELGNRIDVTYTPKGYASLATFQGTVKSISHEFGPASWHASVGLDPYETTWESAAANWYTVGATLSASDVLAL